MYIRNAQGWSKHLDFILVEFLSLQIAYILASLIRHGNLPYTSLMYRNLGIVLLLIDAVVLMFLNTMHDVLKRGYYVELVQTIKHCLIVFGLATAYLFSTQLSESYSRIVLYITLAFHIVIGFLARVLWKKYILKHGNPLSNKSTMLVVLNADSADYMMDRLLKNSLDNYDIVGVVMNKGNRKQVGGIPVVCKLEETAGFISQKWIDSVYIDCPSTDPLIAKLMDDCHTMAVPVHYHVPAMTRDGSKQFVEKIGGTTVLTTSINYATPVQLVLKRSLDIAGGLVGSMIALIIMVIVGPVIKKKSPGPIIFKQTRIGRNGQKFQIYKLRSMYMDAEERKKELWKDSRGAMFKLDFDPRVIGNEILPDGSHKTGIGEFIRKTSLDEFPQFFNVLKGEMSLVGTRPPTVDEWEKYEFHHRARLACKPGITGMWQVSGRSEITDFEEVVKLDTKYITNWSMGQDIKILFKTIWIVVTRRGAM